MTRIVIFDAFSYLRLRLEDKREPAHLMIRGVLNDASAPGRVNIFCWDSKGGNDARRAIYPGYKNRPKSPNDMYAAIQLLKELLAFTPAWQVSLEGYEGDDLIAALVEQFRGKTPIQIITRDGDLTALCGDGVTCMAPSKVPPNLVRLYKTCVGDASDTIPGIKGFGQKSWDDADKTRLAAFIDQVLTDQTWSEADAHAAGLSKASTNWLMDNVSDLKAMSQIIAPLPIPADILNSAIKAGKSDPAAIDAALQRFLQ